MSRENAPVTAMVAVDIAQPDPIWRILGTVAVFLATLVVLAIAGPPEVATYARGWLYLIGGGGFAVWLLQETVA